MANTTIDTEAFKAALREISKALESIELSVRSGARLRASDLKAMTDAINKLIGDLEQE